ncbi:carboxypeptidase-like regulatory domain-containing protein [Aquimarina longa]|uniref:carboxypeptidase-like regulatory domain-containing protein n=1 Tax=Aquimarina longa TaxID=1080221 RepID=UPI0007811EA4|nr:carboxypeptidase-like regulatory domain-containing protein [Aquimarina longa]
MRKAIVVNIPKPCHEDWNVMTSIEKGKHCEVCAKTVHDFTDKTDEQIIKIFEKEGNICGRFSSLQLGRELSYTRKDKNSYLSYAASGIFAFLALSSNTTNGQERPQIATHTSVIPNHVNQVKGKVATSILEERTISGTIVDENGDLLPGVTILIKGTSTGTQTDFDGVFKLKVKQNAVLTISYIGYKDIEVKVSGKSIYDITLTEEDYDLMGDIAITTVCDAKKPYPYTPEELEAKRIKEFRNTNNKKFYQRKRLEAIKAKKMKRQQIRNGEIERTRWGKVIHTITHVFSKKDS